MTYRIVRSIVTLGIAACAGLVLPAQMSSPALLILNKSENALLLIDPASKRVIGKVATGEGPHELAVAADGKLAFVGNYGSGQTPGHTISVIDLGARKELRKVDVIEAFVPCDRIRRNAQQRGVVAAVRGRDDLHQLHVDESTRLSRVRRVHSIS